MRIRIGLRLPRPSRRNYLNSLLSFLLQDRVPDFHFTALRYTTGMAFGLLFVAWPDFGFHWRYGRPPTSSLPPMCTTTIPCCYTPWEFMLFAISLSVSCHSKIGACWKGERECGEKEVGEQHTCFKRENFFFYGATLVIKRKRRGKGSGSFHGFERHFIEKTSMIAFITHTRTHTHTNTRKHTHLRTPAPQQNNIFSFSGRRNRDGTSCLFSFHFPMFVVHLDWFSHHCSRGPCF